MPILRNGKSSVSLLNEALGSWNDLIAPCLSSFDGSDGGYVLMDKGHGAIYWNREVDWFIDYVGFSLEEIEAYEDDEGDYHHATSNWEELVKAAEAEGASTSVAKAVRDRIAMLRLDDYLCGRRGFTQLSEDDTNTPRVIVEAAIAAKERRGVQERQGRIQSLRKRIAENLEPTFPHSRSPGMDTQLREMQRELDGLLTRSW